MKKLIKIFGDSPKAKILDFLLDHPEEQFTKTYIIEKSKVGRVQFYKYLGELLEEKVVVTREKIGRIQLIQINQRNELVRTLLKLRKEGKL